MHQNAPNCSIQKKNFRGSMPPNPPSKRLATPRIASPHPKKNSWPPLANPACAHELYMYAIHVLLRNLFENPPWQTVDCV